MISSKRSGMKLKTIIAFLLLACGTAFSQTDDCASLTHQALDLSGFNQTIDYLTSALVSDEFMQQMRGKMDSDEFLAAIKPVLEKEFSSAILRREMQSRVSAGCNPV